MTPKSATRNIVLFYVFRLFVEPLFYGPIIISFIQHNGRMSLAQVYFMESACLVGVLLLEIPSGAIADILGRRLTILIGSILGLVDVVMMTFAFGPAMVWAANIVWVFSYVMISGADTSLLYDSLKVIGRENDFRRIHGNASALNLYATAGCAIIVGYLAQTNLRIPVALSAVFMVGSVVAAYLFTEPPYAGHSRYSLAEHWRVIRQGVALSFSHRRICWAMAFTVFIGVVSKIWFFTYNPYFELVELPLPYYGWLFFLLNIVAAVFSHEAARLHRHLGDFGSVVLIVLAVGLPLLAMGAFVAPACVLLVLFQNVVRGYLSPFIEHYQHDLFVSETRATCASVSSAMRGLGEAVILGAFGILLGNVSLPGALVVLGAFALIGGALLIWRFRVVSR